MIQILLEGDPRDFLIYRYGSGGTVEIFDIQVGSQRGVGKGRKLVDLLLNKVKGRTHLIFAITRATNLIAREFYEKIGFHQIAELPGFYENSVAVMYGRKV